jgi:hypothetical protein
MDGGWQSAATSATIRARLVVSPLYLRHDPRGQATDMTIKDKLLAGGMKLASSPSVMRVMQDERLTKVLMTVMSVPGKVSTFTAEQKEAFAKTMGLATADDVRDLKRTVAALERTVARIEGHVRSP